MVAHLVRLKLSLLRNGLRRSAWQVVGTVLGLLYGLGVLGGVLVGLGALGIVAEPETRATVLVLVGSLAVIGWWVIPVVAFGTDATLDPRRFVLFAVPRRQLAAGLLLASLVGVPGIITAVAALGTVLAWWQTPVAAVVALLGGVLGLAVCVVGCRAVTTALSPLAERRRFREAFAILLMVPLVLAGPILSGVARGLEEWSGALPAARDVLAWTPFGAPWALAADAEAGRWGALGLRAVVVLVSLGLLWLLWEHALGRALVRPPGGVAGARAHGLGMLGRLPGNPTGAIAARSLVYWSRDPRYSAGLVVVPLLPVVLWFSTEGSDVMLAVGPFTALLVGWVISADVAYDHTAFWMHVAAPVRGWADRAGRALAAAVVGVPAALVLTVVSVALTGRWDALVTTAALSLGCLAGTLGVASAASSFLVYPVPKPGDSPFATPQGGSGMMMLAQFGGLAVVLAVLSPAAVLGVVAIVQGGTGLAIASVLTSLVLGAGLLLLGIRLGASVYDRSPARLLSRVMAHA